MLTPVATSYIVTVVIHRRSNYANCELRKCCPKTAHDSPPVKLGPHKTKTCIIGKRQQMKDGIGYRLAKTVDSNQMGQMTKENERNFELDLSSNYKYEMCEQAGSLC
ncbi:hypothetical protein T265_04052 [Opisthorchis viverrini]|uniref:Uncharacterized protein n=1 Tax=Opisthorchis viverrini TaxID=6198 RepID=A0A075AH30_OPIVI|nr:hypothetical protein T265_04052 [Opisthorchis viverrini]KER29309.1 hypothetical protein T265_04052 [Opisthorchis viverrini]